MTLHENQARYAEQVLARLREWQDIQPRIKARHQSAPIEGQYIAVPEYADVLPPGVTQLYSHQHGALQLSLQGTSLSLATPTASGKTYAMALPGQVRRQGNAKATTLVIAPTRALIEQWVVKCQEWNPDLLVASYTSDTPRGAERDRIRERAQIVVTTPDMLHQGLLPYHEGWKRFFRHCGDVLIDESHGYYGIFGTHMSLVLRRLQRVIGLYRTTPPVYCFGSATIGNPAEHPSALLGQPVETITDSGAPSGGRLTLLWEPAVGRTHTEEAAGLLAFCVSNGIRAILFGQSRQGVEKMLREVHKHLPDALKTKVVAYRAGYLKADRARIERQLNSGDLYGVVSTSALEVGIDVGDLDVCIQAGFPGSISSYRQRQGRAGRRDRGALSILVLRNNALDQYFALHPERLLEASPEKALINPGNPYILPAHLVCAAIEYPLRTEDLVSFGGEQAQRQVEELVEQGILWAGGDRYHPVHPNKSTAFGISLRQDNGAQLAMMTPQGQKIEDIAASHAMTECFPGAIYYSQSQSYKVLSLNFEEGRVIVLPKDVAYHTQPLVHQEVEILLTEQQQHREQMLLYTGQVYITRYITRYARILGGNILEFCDLPGTLSMPLETKALWMVFSEAIIAALVEQGHEVAGSLHAMEHAMIALMPLFVLGDSRDMGGVSITPEHHQTRQPTIFLYDGYPGGIGHAEEAFRQWNALATATLEMLEHCECEGGCNACVMSPRCGSQNKPLDKMGAIALLQLLLG